MKEALSMGKDYLIVGSSSARKVCQRFGFLEREPLEYCYLDVSGMERLNPATWVFRLLRKVLKPLKVKVNIDNRITRGFSQLLSPLTLRLFLIWLDLAHRDILKDVNVEEVNQVQPETPEQLAALGPVVLVRGAEIVNWMLKYPWVLETGHSGTEKMDYFFTDVRDHYRNIAIELSAGSHRDYRGYAVLSVSTYRKRMALKVQDTSFKDPTDERYVLPLAIRYAREVNAEVIDISKRQAETIQSRFLSRVLLHRKKRIYQCYPASADSPLALAWIRSNSIIVMEIWLFRDRRQLENMKRVVRKSVKAAVTALPWQVLIAFVPRDVISVFYHVVSEQPVIHTDHLYAHRPLELFEKDLQYRPAAMRRSPTISCAPEPGRGYGFCQNHRHLSFDDSFASVTIWSRPLLLRYSIPCSSSSRFYRQRRM
jgi:hypothetical protein